MPQALPFNSKSKKFRTHNSNNNKNDSEKDSENDDSDGSEYNYLRSVRKEANSIPAVLAVNQSKQLP